MFSIFWPVRLALGLLKFLFNLLVLASCVLSVMALMGDKGWLWSLTTHYRVQYFAIQAVALVVCLLGLQLRRRDRDEAPSLRLEQQLTIFILLVFAGLNLSRVIPYYLPLSSADARMIESLRQTRHLRLMHCNLFGFMNHSSLPLIQAIRTEDPDLLDLVEYTEGWRSKLERSGVLRAYPYRLTGSTGVALYSKVPLKYARLVYAPSKPQVSHNANIIAQITVNREPVTLLVAHPASPIMPSHLRWLQNSFKIWERERHRLGRNLILVGDLNTSPWSVEFETLTRATGLRDSQIGYGLQPTWPMLLPVLGVRNTPTLVTNLMGIPIDHMLVSDRIAVLGRKTGPFIGSDHLPVIMDFSLRPRQ